MPHFFADAASGKTVEQATEEYLQGIEWKRETHTRFGTTLIETYSHEMFDDVLFEKLTQQLTAAGITLQPKTPEEIWQIISDSAKDEIDSVVSLFQTFITLMKSNGYSINDVREKNRQVKGRFLRERNALFIDIIAPVYERYQNYLAKRREIDFSDMITKATEYISSGIFKKRFSYVIIDEFQDISIGRYQLVMAIKERNPSCRLFCVGDDWQSIYRFSGSDISLFKDFEKYFGFSIRSKIETTYRFHSPLIGLSSEFILRNPNQVRKDLVSANANKNTTHKIVYSDSEDQDDTEAVLSIFNELVQTGQVTDKEIIILGRHSFDFNRIRNTSQIFNIDRRASRLQYRATMANGNSVQVTAHYMTVHKSKGLEADIAIVINCNTGKHGFPSGVADDHVLNLLLSEADQFENGEERRLFYVAMTRAKEMVYFVADRVYKSKFIMELEVGGVKSDIRKCPKCVTADLVKRAGKTNGREWAFYGCSNYRYGCGYREWVR